MRRLAKDRMECGPKEETPSEAARTNRNEWRCVMKEELDFKVVRGEVSRTYQFSTGLVRFDKVVKLCVRPSGCHRLETADGKKHIVAPHWLSIEIEAESWSL
jgi:hypothetical protein